MVGFYGSVRFHGEGPTEFRAFGITHAGAWGKAGYPVGFAWNHRCGIERGPNGVRLIGSMNAIRLLTGPSFSGDQDVLVKALVIEM